MFSIGLIFCALIDLVFSYTHLKQSCINTDCSATRVSIFNPPINLWDSIVIGELNSFLTDLNEQNSTKVVVFASDNPEFFGSAIDLNLFTPAASSYVNATHVLEQYYANLDLLLSTPVIFIAEVNGRTFGAGDEHVVRMDMRFAGPQAQFGAPEAAVGLIHVGGMQQLVRLIGPGSAAEYMMSAAQVDSVEAARIGWVNSAFENTTGMRNHVDRLASRIALFQSDTLKATKASIAEQAASQQIFSRDLQRFNSLAATPFVQDKIRQILTASNNQSELWELNNNDNIVKYLY